ncbi:MAG: GDYXXLXY domain-containing protein [Candidatus Wallbacteria bacterium]|nr:GDYXXLXY domain-containing protein [Candidatus Wallbacteria bacterium]
MKMTLTLLLSLFFVQICVPVFMISDREHTLKSGEQIKLKTAPVDPYDAFRGRYVMLEFQAEAVKKSLFKETPKKGQSVYAGLSQDQNGFATVTSVSRSRPEGLFIRARTGHVSGSDDSTINLIFPADRFYMDEFKAPEAEQAYWGNNSRQRSEAYALLRVRNGKVVLEDLYIKDKPVLQFIKEHHERKVPAINYDELRDKLIQAATYDDFEAVRSLLEEGADLHSPNKEGWTAPLCAVYYGSRKALNVMMEHDHFPRNVWIDLALVAEMIGDVEIAEILRKGQVKSDQ